MSVDPVYNGPSGYVGMLNNPVSTVDPNGEEPISITTALIIAASVSATSYTASVALSDGGFNNWDWGQFGKQVFIGTASGAVTFGIGEYFKTVAEVGKISKTLLEASRLATHATFQGGLSAAQGGDFWSAFASGAAGSLVGLGTEGLKGADGAIASIGSAMLLGGATSEFTGGDFWKGAAISGIVAGANHVAHRTGERFEEKIAKNRAAKNGECPKCPPGNDPNAVDPSTVGNWFYRYGGPNNPKSFNGEYNYDLSPINVSDKASFIHDKAYDEVNAVGGLDLVLNFSVIDADRNFVRNQFRITGKYLSQFRMLPSGGVMYTPVIDPVSQQPISIGTATNSLIQGVGLGIIALPKIIINSVNESGY